MITDVRTVMWKEFREGFARPKGGGRFGGLYSLVFTLGVFGVVIPTSFKRDWFGVPTIAVTVLVCSAFIMTTVPDSFAGERDRKTLETLLASRLRARAILLGKLLAATLMGFVISALNLVVAVVAINIADGGSVQIYSVVEVAAALSAALLAGASMATIGVLVSLRAPSAEAAQRVMALGILGVSLGLGAAFSTLPTAWKTTLERLAERVGASDPGLLVLAGVALLLVIDGGLFAVASALFQRPKLVKP